MIGQIRSALEHPWTAVRRAKVSITRPFIDTPNDLTDHFDEDWDNLVILDACRFDMFEASNTIPGDLSKIHSSASHTTDFVKNNLSEPRHDTVYVTASPQIAGYEDNLHDVVHVWKNRWNEEYSTVLPADTTEVAIQVASQYPDKRLVVHYMQPHYPFIGPKRDSIGRIATYSGGHDDRDHASVWDLMTAGKISEKTAKKAYRENLQLTLPHVEELVLDLVGKTVVSSDHGNLFNKRVGCLPLRINGHPMGYLQKELVEVPWLEIPFEQRRQITTGDTSSQKSPDSDKIKERLSDLGYVD
jgi:hypothetical protein